MNDFLQYLPDLFKGLLITVELAVSALVIGFFLALLLLFFLESRVKVLQLFSEIFIFIFRGTPLLVQIFIIYYGSGQLVWIKETFLWTILKEPFFCAVIALALNTSAYTTVLLKGGIHAVPSGEIEAGYALGLSRWKMYTRIIIPRAWRIALPAYSNEVVMVVKGTSLASTITVMDLMRVTRDIIAITYQTIPFFLMAAVLYFLLNTLLMSLFYYVQKKTSFDY